MLLCVHQTSANNSTPLRYSKKNCGPIIDSWSSRVPIIFTNRNRLNLDYKALILDSTPNNSTLNNSTPIHNF